MQTFRKFIIPINLLFWLSSCGIDLLDVELPAGEAKLVIEGSISNLAPPHWITISWSTPFNSHSTHYEPNALVILSDSKDRPDTLAYTEDGRYESNLEGKPGLSYQLLVQLDGKEFQAVSVMPPSCLN